MSKKSAAIPRRGGVRRAFSYIRFSTPEQLKGDSLRRQLEASEEYASRHNLVLDDSLQLRDLGISAFRGKNVREGALAAFVEAVNLGKVPTSSVLIVESLDRISRDQIGEALSLFISILNRGIQIATITPERLYTKQSINDVAGILEAIIYMARAHEESAMKSQRVRQAWEAKRRAIGSHKLTAQCPAWLRLHPDRTRYELIPQHVAIVKKIFQLAVDGHGSYSIANQLHKAGVPPIGRSKCWHMSSIKNTLNNRAVLGEFQFHTGQGKVRKPLGEPIKNYFPRIISDALWAKAHAAIASRTKQHGPQGPRLANLFTGLLRDARDGATMTIVHKGSTSNGFSIVSSAARRGEVGSKYVSFPYDALEDALLRWTKELTPEDLLPAGDADQAVDELAVCQGRLAELQSKIEQCKKRLIAEPNFDALADVLSRLQEEQAEVSEQCERLQQEIHAKRPASLRDAQQIIGALRKAEGDERLALRRRLRSKLHRILEEVWLLIVNTSSQERTALVQVHLVGDRFRKLAIHKRRGEAMAWHEVQEDSANSELLGIDLRKFRTGKAIPQAWQ